VVVRPQPPERQHVADAVVDPGGVEVLVEVGDTVVRFDRGAVDVEPDRVVLLDLEPGLPEIPGRYHLADDAID